MLVIDVHTHVFPDAIAKRASDNVGTYYSLEMMADGTVAELLNGAKKMPFETKFIISNAALKAKNVRHGNVFLLELAQREKRFIPLGSVHPSMTPDEAFEELEYIKLNGGKGIKLHSDFQNFELDAPEMTEIYEMCAELGLPILFHMGDENTTLSKPKRLYKVMERVPSLTVIAAHMGGYMDWDEAEEVLVGTHAYMDTSDALLKLPPERVMRQIERHGCDKIMFGSDYPLCTTDRAFELIDALPLDAEQKEYIYHRTAETVFGI